MLKFSILQNVVILFTCFFYLNISYHAFAQTTAQGMVFLDTNKNGEQDSGEQPLPNVCVSNGQEVAVTDAAGRWSLPAGDVRDFS